MKVGNQVIIIVRYLQTQNQNSHNLDSRNMSESPTLVIAIAHFLVVLPSKTCQILYRIDSIICSVKSVYSLHEPPFSLITDC